jgi:restriction system protein
LLHGRKRQYIAPSPAGMVNPAAIPGTSLWVETNQSGDSAQKFARSLLIHFDEDEGNFAVALT